MTSPASGRVVEVVAHRGSSETVAEHTLAAYRQAVEEGADALECDVRLTSDGVPVCVHDRRVDRTSDGHGLVSTLELTDLDALDFGSWKTRWDGVEEAEAPDLVSQGGAASATADRDATRVLTLERLLAYVVDCGRPVGLAVETKHPTRYAGLLERRVVEVLDRFGLARARTADPAPVRVMSFSRLGLRRVRALAPDLGTVQLVERVPRRMRDGVLPRGVGAVGPSIELVRARPGFVRRVQERGYGVHVWTVDRDEDVDLCLEAGVDAIITNRPAAVRARREARD